MRESGKQRSIILRDWEVRAIREGRKTELLRAVKPQPPAFRGEIEYGLDSNNMRVHMLAGYHDGDWRGECPFGQPGDAMWVKETWLHGDAWYPDAPWKNTFAEGRGYTTVNYKASATNEDLRELAEGGYAWRSPVTMPRWASRLTLTITSVRVMRLWDVTDEQARRLGIVDGDCLNCGQSEPCDCDDPSPCPSDEVFWHWNNDHGRDASVTNPWAWAIGIEKQ